MSGALRETDVAKVVVDHLAAEGWEVHEEVAVGPGVADIVALMEVPRRRMPLLRRVEVKTALNVDVVQQALDAFRYPHTHTVEVAVPWRNRVTSTQTFLRRLLVERGIGILAVRMDAGGGCGRVDVDTPARFRRVDRYPDPMERRRMLLDGLQRTRKFLRQHENIAPAGTNRGGFWTPYKGTMHRIRQLIRERGEVTLGEIMADAKHHYRADSTARARIPANLAAYEEDWCEAVERDGLTWYRLVGTNPPPRLPPPSERTLRRAGRGVLELPGLGGAPSGLCSRE